MSAVLTPSTRLAVSLFAALVAATNAGAHETWLMPETFWPTAGEETTLRMTSGMAFPALNSGIDPSRIKEAVLAQNGDRQVLPTAGQVDGALELSARGDQGLACAWVALKPRILEIDEDGVAHYLEEIGASDALWSTWNNQASPREWRESYSKLARTYLRSSGSKQSSIAKSNCWEETSSARFEILPLEDPSQLYPGASLSLQVLFDGQPLADQAVGLIREGDEPNPLLRSDEQGRITLSFKDLGRHMIYATALRPIEDAAEQAEKSANWESDFITLTVDVRDLSR